MRDVVNRSASVAARIRNWAKANGRTYQHALTRFATERFCARLAASEYASRLVLKGGNLFIVWLSGKDYRPTMDTDFFCRGPVMGADAMAAAFADICNVALPDDDGLRFDASSIDVDPIREDTKYGGERVSLLAYLGTMRIPMQFDVGFGDAVTPCPETVSFPAMLDFPAPSILAYPMATVLAEKCAIMVEKGFANSRMKDFFDVWTMLDSFDVDENLVKRALAATFKRRGTEVDMSPPTCFSEEFAHDSVKATQWRAFLRKNAIAEKCPGDFAEIVGYLAAMIIPLLPGKIENGTK